MQICARPETSGSNGHIWLLGPGDGVLWDAAIDNSWCWGGGPASERLLGTGLRNQTPIAIQTDQTIKILVSGPGVIDLDPVIEFVDWN